MAPEDMQACLAPTGPRAWGWPSRAEQKPVREAGSGELGSPATYGHAFGRIPQVTLPAVHGFSHQQVAQPPRRRLRAARRHAALPSRWPSLRSWGRGRAIRRPDEVRAIRPQTVPLFRMAPKTSPRSPSPFETCAGTRSLALVLPGKPGRHVDGLPQSGPAAAPTACRAVRRGRAAYRAGGGGGAPPGFGLAGRDRLLIPAPETRLVHPPFRRPADASLVPLGEKGVQPASGKALFG